MFESIHVCDTTENKGNKTIANMNLFSISYPPFFFT
jgi:hypothetical protein